MPENKKLSNLRNQTDSFIYYVLMLLFKDKLLC